MIMSRCRSLSCLRRKMVSRIDIAAKGPRSKRLGGNRNCSISVFERELGWALFDRVRVSSCCCGGCHMCSSIFRSAPSSRELYSIAQFSRNSIGGNVYIIFGGITKLT